MNIVVVPLYANADQFDICLEVTLTTAFWLHIGPAAHRPHRNSACNLFMSSEMMKKSKDLFSKIFPFKSVLINYSILPHRQNNIIQSE